MDMTASLTLDYNLTPNEFLLSPTSAVITLDLYIDIIDDNLLEPEESFNIVLSINGNTVTQLLVRIRDNDEGGKSE